MYIARSKWPSKDGKKIYQSIWLRESYREKGKIKTRNVANLKNCSVEEIAAIELALKHKDNLSFLQSTADIEIQQGPSIGALWVVHALAKKIGVLKALGYDKHGKRAAWQVLARLLDQGSRLSAARLARELPVVEVLGLEHGLDEDDLYENLGWLAERQQTIEDRLFQRSHDDNQRTGLFLYDVTSSYLEGDHNELADWGYNRDRKRGKKQIVIGLLCDHEGRPLSTEVFEGNTSDLQTFSSQLNKVASRFGCHHVTFVGDRGMIKSGQIGELGVAGFNYVTAIGKPQIRSLIKKGVFQLGLFDENLCEVAHDGVRYILRRNPIRAAEMATQRQDKLEVLRKLVARQNCYLAEHSRADEHTAWRKVSEKREQLKIGAFVKVTARDRIITLDVDEEYVRELSDLDGCYALKTDVPIRVASTEMIHARYKDLALVERAFRTMKTGFLQIRPVYVRKAAHTRAHVLVVMLAYLLTRELEAAWSGINITVREGLDHLKRLSAVKVGKANGLEVCRIPSPDRLSAELLGALDIRLSSVLPRAKLAVGTRKSIARKA